MFSIVRVIVIKVLNRGLHEKVVILVPLGHHKVYSLESLLWLGRPRSHFIKVSPHRVGEDPSIVDQFLVDHQCLQLGVAAELIQVGEVRLLVGLLVVLSFHRVEVVVQFRLEAIKKVTVMLFQGDPR